MHIENEIHIKHDQDGFLLPKQQRALEDNLKDTIVKNINESSLKHIMQHTGSIKLIHTKQAVNNLTVQPIPINLTNLTNVKKRKDERKKQPEKPIKTPQKRIKNTQKSPDLTQFNGFLTQINAKKPVKLDKSRQESKKQTELLQALLESSKNAQKIEKSKSHSVFTPKREEKTQQSVLSEKVKQEQKQAKKPFQAERGKDGKFQKRNIKNNRLSSFFQTISGSLKKLLKTRKSTNASGKMLGGLLPIAARILPVIGAVGSFFGGFFLGKFLIERFNRFLAENHFAKAIKNQFADFTGSLKTNFEGAISELKSVVGAVKNALSNFAGNVIEKLPAPVQEVAKKLPEKVKEKASQVKEKAGQVKEKASQVIKGVIGGFKNFIAKGESKIKGKSEYDVANVKKERVKFVKNKNGKLVKQKEVKFNLYKGSLQNKTIGEVMQMQKEGKLFATGKYQVIPSTLKMAVKGLKLDKNQKYDAETQEKIGTWLALEKQPAIKEYIKTGKGFNKAALAASREWASIPVLQTHQVREKGKVVRVVKRGQSYYSNGIDKAQHSAEAFEKEFGRLPILFQEALNKGMSEKEAYEYAIGGIRLSENTRNATPKKPNNTATIKATINPVAVQQTAKTVSLPEKQLPKAKTIQAAYQKPLPLVQAQTVQARQKAPLKSIDVKAEQSSLKIENQTEAKARNHTAHQSIGRTVANKQIAHMASGGIMDNQI